jgi:alpha-beta hydrolase superfamily lysophospholipase
MDTVTTRDGLNLVAIHWPARRAQGEPPRGLVVIVHGLGEHCGRYAHVARRLNEAGFDAIGYDHRGHGRSPGRRGAMPADDTLCDDLGAVLRAARARFAGPLVLLGHSLGGLVVGRFVAEGLAAAPAAWWRPVDALMMSSPALDAGTNRMQKLLLATVARLLPDLAVDNGLAPNWISRNPATLEAVATDPLVHHKITGRLGTFAATQGACVIAAASRWTTPTLLMWAGADRCVAPRGSAAFAAAAPRDVAVFREWPGLYHEIFNEPEQDDVLDALLGWLDRTFPAPGTAPGAQSTVRPTSSRETESP